MNFTRNVLLTCIISSGLLTSGIAQEVKNESTKKDSVLAPPPLIETKVPIKHWYEQIALRC